MRPAERLLQQPWGTGWAGGQNLKRLRGRNKLSSISPFKDYPHNPRTCIARSVTQEKPNFQSLWNQIQF